MGRDVVREFVINNQSGTIPLLTTVVLNWNRSDLLRITIESYIKTVEIPYELIIVDNGSTDDSVHVINELVNKYKDEISRVILLEKNIGGEAINIGLSRARGYLLHISENDLEYLPHWSSKVLKLFKVFDRLGQLSLFSPVPSDEEVWEVHPIKEVLYKEGEIIYEAAGNVGTSSVIRREVWDKGVRIHTIVTKNFLFPDDERLSQDIKKLGYIVAWSPYYLVRNLGHSYQEMIRRIDYYIKNYESKEWLRVHGLKKRLEYWEKKVKPERKTEFGYKLDTNILVQPEISMLFKPQAVDDKILDAQAWSCTDAVTPELETVNLIYSLIRATKPSVCIETNPFRGVVTKAVLEAIAANKLGSLYLISEYNKQDLLNVIGNYNNVRLVPTLEDARLLAGKVDCIVIDSFGNDKVMFAKFLPKLLSGRGIIMVTGDYDRFDSVLKAKNIIERRGFICTIISTARGFLICTSKSSVISKYYYYSSFREKLTSRLKNWGALLRELSRGMLCKT